MASSAGNAIASATALPTRLKELSGQAEGLWEKAAKTLSDEDRQKFNPAQADKLRVVDDVLRAVKDKRETCLKKRWTFKKPNGEHVILRDLCEKIVVWLNKFKEVGDVAVQYDPAHAALPWAGVRFILQAAVSDHQMFGAWLEGVERVSNLITHYAIIEALYLRSSTSNNGPVDDLESHTKSELENALVELYAAILQYLAKAGEYYDHNSAKRVLRSIVKDPESVDRYFGSIQVQEDEVKKCQASIGQDTLRRIFGQDKDMYQKLEDLLYTLHQPINRMASQLSELHDSMKKEERRELLQWLSKVHYKEHHRAIKDLRLPKSGEWLLSNSIFVEWTKSSSSSVFWLHGIPGSGKSYLVSLIVDTLACNSPGIAHLSTYFYCKRSAAESERSNPEEILRCILKQLCSSTVNQPIRDPVARTYTKLKEEADDDGLEPSRLSLKDCVTHIIQILENNPAIIVLDALDECDSARRHELLQAMDEIIQKSTSLVKIFASSRDDKDIWRKLEKSCNISINASNNTEDIENFVKKQVDESIGNGRLLYGDVSSELKNEIENCLISKAQGMFRWVELQIQNICDRERFKQEGDIREELGKIPKTLKESYDIIYQQINHLGRDSKRLAERAISWLLCAQNTLKSEAFINAITASYEQKVISQREVLDVCRNLVVFDQTLDLFRFAHLSTQEYLQGRPEYTMARVHTVAAKDCLDGYLIPQKPSKPNPLKYNFRSWPYYMGKYLPMHLQLVGSFQDEDLRGKIDRFVDAEDGDISAFERWEICTQRHNPLGAMGIWTKHPLCMAVAYGIGPIIDRLIQPGRLNLVDRTAKRCCEVAGVRGEVDSLEKLLSNGFSLTTEASANILRNVQGNSKKITNIVLRENGYKASEPLLEGAAANFSYAVEIMEQLLSRDSDANITANVLMGAIENRLYAKEPTKLLCSRNPCIRITGTFVEKVAQHRPKNEVMRVILDSDADLIVTDDLIYTMCAQFDADNVQHFLSQRTNIEISDSMLDAAVGNSKEVLQLLLNKRGPEESVPQDVFGTAAESGLDIQLQLFLSRYPDILISDDLLIEIAVNDSYSVEDFRLLLEKRRSEGRMADIEISKDMLELVLYEKVFTGDKCTLLLDAVASKKPISRDLVNFLTARCGPDVMQHLLSQYAYIKIGDDMLVAAAENHPRGREIFQIFLDKRGSAVPIPEDVIWTIMTLPKSWMGNPVVDLLFKERILKPVDPISERALRWACSRNNVCVIIDLVRKGVDINSTDDDGNTALDIASAKCHYDIPHLLERKGGVRNKPIPTD